MSEEDVDLWREASPEEGNDFDWSSDHRLEAFAEAVHRRRLRMYRAIYEGLSFRTWLTEQTGAQAERGVGITRFLLGRWSA